MNTLFSPRRRPLWLALALLVLACAAWLGTDGPLGQAGRNRRPAVQATTTQVRQQNVPIVRSGVGTVTPLATVTVRSRIDGQLERVGFVEGQDVKAEAVLAQIDARAGAQLQQAQAQKAKDAPCSATPAST
jgi:multidrug efflux system membrane fusion protein